MTTNTPKPTDTHYNGYKFRRRLIDQLVYQLHGLTAEEIAIVEGQS